MNKDALFATIIGFVIGVFITAGIFFGPKLIKYLPHFTIPSLSFSLPTTNKKDTVKTNKSQPQKTNNVTLLEITSPINESLTDKDTILVSGNAPADNFVTIGGLIDEDGAIVKPDGKFAGKITLSEGKNDISVTAFKGNSILTKTVTVYFTPEKF
jgi:hypothetical protein